MTARHRHRLMALALFLGLLLPSSALAGPFFGDWGWCWHQGRDCPRGEYSPLHYWTPEIYKVRACLRPSNLDQYPPGPFPPIPPTFEYFTYRCRSLPPMPTTPYADPPAYYGRPIAPPRE
jgi:hypothetical protein